VVSYHLIDFGEIETPDTNNFAYTVQASYVLNGLTLTGSDALVRDLFALRVPQQRPEHIIEEGSN